MPCAGDEEEAVMGSRQVWRVVPLVGTTEWREGHAGAGELNETPYTQRRTELSQCEKEYQNES